MDLSRDRKDPVAVLGVAINLLVVHEMDNAISMVSF